MHESSPNGQSSENRKPAGFPLAGRAEVAGVETAAVPRSWDLGENLSPPSGEVPNSSFPSRTRFPCLLTGVRRWYPLQS